MGDNQSVRILVVEDDPTTGELLELVLTEAGFVVDLATSGTEGLERGKEYPYQAMIFDVMLPGMDGLELLQRLRELKVDTPVLILSSKGSVSDRVAGLQIGGDDYLTKPFAVAELLARIQSLLRRSRIPQESLKLKSGGLEVDLLNRKVYRDSEEILLQPQEFSLLEYLLRNSGRTVSRDEILQHVWGYNFRPSTNLVEVHICRLREKIERPEKPKLLTTVRGKGYMFVEE